MRISPRLALQAFRVGWAPLVVALSGLLLQLLPWQGQLEEDLGLSLLYALRGPEAPPGEVVIVGIDHESALRFQAPDDPHEWSRRLHAEMIHRARDSGARLVAFDIFFSGASSEPDADQAMASAMREAGNVVLTDYVRPRQVLAGIYVEAVAEPVAELAEAALATAPFLLPKNATGTNRFLTFFGEEDERTTLPSLLFLVDTLHISPDRPTRPVLSSEPALAALVAGYAIHDSRRPDFDGLARKLSRQLRTRPDFRATLERPAPNRDHPEAPPRLRSLARLFTGDGTRYLNHYGPARSFTTLSYHRLVESPPGSLAELLENKILLVGYLEDFQPESTEGLFYTPFSPVSSVELAATALANLLEDKRVTPAFTSLSAAFWLLAWGALLGVCAEALSVQRGLAVIALLGAGYLAGAWAMFRAEGLWLPIVIPVAWQVPAALLASVWLNYLKRARREEKMQSVIERFIPVDVFSQLTRHENSATLPAYGRLVPGVCLATDAGRYTALAETMEPMTLARLMNAYYEAIFEPVTRRGGWISDVIGDAMLAIWLAEDDADAARYEALSAALEIRQAVRRFEQAHKLILPIRMGLHYGELRVGYVGTQERGEIRAVGDTVNTATRLEALNKLLGSQILVSEQLLEGLSVSGIRPLGEFLLAGKTRPVAVAELVAGPDEQPEPTELHVRFREAMALFRAEKWPDANAAFTLLNLQFPDDGPTRFYHKTCQSYLADPAMGTGSGIAVNKPDPARLLNQ